MVEEEYEVIPTSPLRRLEKRISKVEASSSTSQIQKLIEQIIELIKSNQRIIDDVIKADSELRNEISKLPGRIDVLVSSMSEFIELLKASATEEAVAGVSKDVMEPLVNKMDELVNQNKKGLETSQAVLNSLGMIDNRLKRLYLQSSTGTASYKR
ncbi:MAG: hypothetical protein KAU24_00305 [Candidatus Aenigmarchaeota archaeon]|nr:hypothetical protein [Candidatus Aenigmarchaeota archaeon]